MRVATLMLLAQMPALQQQQPPPLLLLKLQQLVLPLLQALPPTVPARAAVEAIAVQASS
jgi:hypothetical protein